MPCSHDYEYEDAELERGAVKFCKWALTSPRNLVLPSKQSTRVSSSIICFLAVNVPGVMWHSTVIYARYFSRRSYIISQFNFLPSTIYTIINDWLLGTS